MSERITINGIETDSVAFHIKPGDIITFGEPLPDHRNWWQRRAPSWLGGRMEPPVILTVTYCAASDVEFTHKTN